MSSNVENPLAKLSRGQRIAAGGALVLLIATFLPWVTASAKLKGAAANLGLGFARSASASGWSAYSLGKLVTLLALVILAVLAVEVFAPQVTLPFPPALIVLGAAALALLFVLYHLLFLGYDYSVPKEVRDSISFSVGRGWGMFVALIAAGVTTYGAWLRLGE